MSSNIVTLVAMAHSQSVKLGVLGSYGKEHSPMLLLCGSNLLDPNILQRNGMPFSV